MLYEVKVKINCETADGTKQLAELYLVNAESVIEAENKVRSADSEICSIKQTKISDIKVIGTADHFYSIKALLSVLNEKSGTEKETIEQFVIAAPDFNCAKKNADEYLAGFASYLETLEIKKTKISEYYE